MLAQILRDQPLALARLKGRLRRLKRKGVGPGGGDIYEATFANGKREFRVLLDPQGRIDAMGIQLG